MFDASFFVGVAFILLLVLIYKPAWRFLRTALDGKIIKIKRDIEEAASAKELAASLLSSALKRQKESARHVQEILGHSREELKRLKAESETELETYKSIEERLLKERVERAEREISHEVEQKAIEVSLFAAQKVLKGSVNKDIDQKAIEEAIRIIEKIPA